MLRRVTAAASGAIMIELLEVRRLLSSELYARVTSRGTLLVSGTSKRDDIYVERDLSDVIVTRNGDGGRAFLNVRRLQVDGHGSDDRIENYSDLRSLLNGEGGDDTIIGGSNRDTLDGGGGSDWLDGKADKDTTSYAQR